MKLELNNKFKITGHVDLYSLPLDITYDDFKNLSGEQKKEYLIDSGENLVVDAGMQQIIALMIGDNTTSWTYCAVGSGSTTPASTDTTLTTEIGRNVVNDRYRVGNVAHFDTFFYAGDHNGSWYESGILTASSGGTLLCHKLFSALFTKATTNQAVVAWSITFSAVAD